MIDATDVEPERSRTAVVTGAGSGVGRETAVAFAGAGYHVVVVDIDGDRVEGTVALIGGLGASATGAVCDVSAEEQVRHVWDAAAAVTGHIDVVFNNAGISTPRIGMLLEDHTDADFDRLVAVNLKGVFLGCKYAVLHMKQSPHGGVIINTGSVAGMVSWGGAVYGATKAGVMHMTRMLAIEAAPFGVRVNAIAPAAMDTNFGRPDAEAFSDRDPGMLATLAAKHPLGRMVTAADIANAALFLAGPAASNITGIVMPVDGGYAAR